ncbi:MAG: VWA domain-containing protein, partial [Gammaproteobacteria bacterium]|nr:VWA domain-containing protein [Gammaproteobacteria bacterium]
SDLWLVRMLKIIKRHTLLYCAILFGLPSLLLADKELPLDAVVIMDSSGSMKKTDPRELRKPAAKLFISLLDDEDQLSVVSFSDNAYPITFLTQLNSERNKKRSLDATDRISSKGIYTNIYAAINKGIKFLEKSQSLQRDPIIVLMSDGQMDVGDEAQSQALREKIKTELIPLLNEHNIKIYSIAFTEHSDQTLLQEIADATNGRYALAASDDVLHKIFAKIFEQSKEPNMLPLTENSFTVDPSIREITILANKKDENSQILLQAPTGEKYNSTFKSENLKWFVSSSFDMITLSKPEPGEWKILLSNNDNKAYIVADVKLRTSFAYNTDSYFPELSIDTWLIRDQETITHDALLDNLELSLEIEQPNGEVENVSFEKANLEGLFKVTYKPTMNGIYSASVIALSKTFQRQQTFSFRSIIPKQPEPPPVAEPVARPEAKVTKTDIEKPVAEPEQDDLAQALLYFAIFNVIIIFLAVNAYFAYRMYKKKRVEAD